MSYKYGTMKSRVYSDATGQAINEGTRVAVIDSRYHYLLVRPINTRDTPIYVARSLVKLDAHKRKPWWTSIAETPIKIKENAPYSDRILYDEKDQAVVTVVSTVAINGLIGAVEADILGHVLADYVHSERFGEDWKRIARKHFQGEK
jgi:hypothetical protein